MLAGIKMVLQLDAADGREQAEQVLFEQDVRVELEFPQEMLAGENDAVADIGHQE